MRMLTNLFTMTLAATLSTLAFASVASQANINNQLSVPNLPRPLMHQATNQQSASLVKAPIIHPANQLPVTAQAAPVQSAPIQARSVQAPVPQTQAMNQSAAAPEAPESVLLPGSQILAGNPDKNEFFIVGKDQPTPSALVEARKQAEEHVQPVQVAIDETKKTMQEMKVPKLEKALGESTHKVDTQAQASSVVMNALKQSPETAQAENDVNPQIGSMLAAPVLSDATNAPAEPKKVEPVTDAVKAPAKPVKTIKPQAKKHLDNKIVKPVKALTKTSTDKKLPIKHVFTARHVAPQAIASDKKPVVVASESKPVAKVVAKSKPINVKALLAKVEVVKPDLKPVAKKHANVAVKQKTLSAKAAVPSKPKTVSSKKDTHKPVVASTAKKVHLTLAKTKQEVKHGNTSFKVQTVTAE